MTAVPMQDWDGTPSPDALRALAERVLSFVTADGAQVRIDARDHAHTRFANNRLTTSGRATDVDILLTVHSGARRAAARLNGLGPESAQEAVRRAEAAVAVMPDDPEAMPLLGPQTYLAPAAYAEDTVGLDGAVRAAAASDMIAEASRAGLVAAGFVERLVRAEAVLNSAGLFAYHRSTRAALTTTMRTPDGTGSGWAGSTHNAWTRMTAPSELARAAGATARRTTGARAMTPGAYTVVLAPAAVGNLLQLVYRALGARAAAEGRSPFAGRDTSTRVGERVADPRLTLRSDPADPDLLERPFTEDGVPVGRTTWIDEGVLQALAYDRYWAAQQGREPSPLGGGLRLEGGSASLEEVIGSVERGIFVSRFWYIRPVEPRTLVYTGLTRDGTFRIEDGRLAEPVHNMRFTQSLLATLDAVEAVGRPERVVASESGGVGPAVVVPPLAVRDFHFTAVSDAV